MHGDTGPRLRAREKKKKTGPTASRMILLTTTDYLHQSYMYHVFIRCPGIDSKRYEVSISVIRMIRQSYFFLAVRIHTIRDVRSIQSTPPPGVDENTPLPSQRRKPYPTLTRHKVVTALPLDGRMTNTNVSSCESGLSLCPPPPPLTYLS